MSNSYHQDGKEDKKHHSRYLQMKNITMFAMSVNILLSILQIIVGVLFFSQALVADGIHTLGDLVGDFSVLFAAKASNKKADDEHPYGHGKIETLATMVLGLILLFVSAGIVYRAFFAGLQNYNIPSPDILTLYVAIIVVFSKELLFRVTMHFGKKTNSKMLIANAWHYRTDAFSSIVVVVGIIGAKVGFVQADIIAAAIVAMFIAVMGYKMIKQSIAEIIDSSLDKYTRQKIINLAQNTTGVVSLHSLRTRQMGGYSLADIHVQVSPYISVSEGHKISDDVKDNIIKNIKTMNSVTVHVDVENDEKIQHDENYLISRMQIKKQIIPLIPSSYKLVNLTLHYLNNKIDILIVLGISTQNKTGTAKAPLPTNMMTDLDKISESCRLIKYIGKVQICISEDKDVTA